MFFNSPYLTPDADTAHRWATEPETRPSNVTLDAVLVTLAGTLAEEDRLHDELAAMHARLDSLTAEITRLCDELTEAHAGESHTEPELD